MLTSRETLQSIAKEAALMPQEEMLEVGSKKKQLFIGMPKETSYQENRVALVPEGVAVLVNNGHRVVVESKAGVAANFQDNEYSDAGAEIAYDTEKVYEADIILKVAPPSPEEVEMLKPKQTLLSALQITVQPKDFLKKLMAKKVNAVAWDYIMDADRIYPIVRAMGELAGNTSILIAGEYLSNANQGHGVMLGGVAGVAPAEVVIIGAGTVGEFAARAAMGLGATVKIFDDSIYKLRRVQNALGHMVYTSTINSKVLSKALKTADVAIGAMRGKNQMAPCVVSEAMVEKMRPGAVIVDVSIDQGGCFETSRVTNHTDPIFRKHDVVHYCVPNIASRVSRTASKALSNIFTPIMIRMGNVGGVSGYIRTNSGFRNGVYFYNGTLTSESLGERFNLPYKTLDLLIAAL